VVSHDLMEHAKAAYQSAIHMQRLISRLAQVAANGHLQDAQVARSATLIEPQSSISSRIRVRQFSEENVPCSLYSMSALFYCQ
jgi:hypothetical protein